MRSLLMMSNCHESTSRSTYLVVGGAESRLSPGELSLPAGGDSEDGATALRCSRHSAVPWTRPGWGRGSSLPTLLYLETPAGHQHAG